MPLFSSSGYGSGGYGGEGNFPVYTLPIGYYLNLLTSEYRLAPNLNAWLQALLSVGSDTGSLLAGMTEAFDLDLAIGAQLDVAGRILQMPRTVPFQPSGSVSPVLDDTTYRLLLYATIANAQWDGTVEALQPLWSQLFPGGLIRVVDNQNMSATIALSGTFTSIVQDLITNGFIVPRPMGVQYTYIFAALPVFGTDESNSFIAGVDLGHIS